jgi:dolichyl-phosphate-mannose-protein mannosyltransferase
MGKTAYFYYQGNPVIWFAGLFAVIIALGLVLAKAVFGFQVKDTQKLTMLGFFTFLYFLYMAVMSQIDRVMYLYHYLMPLIFAMIALYLLFLILFDELVRANDKLLYYTVSFIALEVFAAFLFFSPFTYGIPLAASDFVKRAWMRVWDLKYLFF